MLVTLKWLNDFVDLKNISLKQITQAFISIGYEVEEMHDLAKGMERVKVGKIVKLTRHPNADKLQICDITLGQEQVQIITAATNVFEGALVPCALDGADLPNGVLIKTTNMRGIDSQGMLCSGEELQINETVYPTANVDGIMILDDKAVPGQPIAEFLGLDDVVFDLKVLPNRPDCQSVVGLAQELAVALNLPFVMEQVDLNITETKPLKIDIDTPNCPVYLGCVIKNVKIQESPAIIRQRLKAVGVTPHNNMVDLTNYILYEMGQPLHAFDYDKITNQHIIVRSAHQGERVLGFHDEDMELNPNITVIADDVQAIGIAGIMGGKNFSIMPDTHNVVLESAIFDRVNIRRGARSLGMRTDASARYERGVETISAKNGMMRALTLIQKYGFGEITPIIQTGTIADSERTITVTDTQISQTLGIDIAKDTVLDILNRLNIKTTYSDGVYTCRIPAIRADIEGFADIIEEVIRFYGYSNITPTRCENTQSIKGGMSERFATEYALKNVMVASGASEVKTYTFRSPIELEKLLIASDSEYQNYVTIQNPLSLDYSIMRTQMLGSMMQVASTNSAHKNNAISIFEIGKVFYNNLDASGLPQEQKVLAYLSNSAEDYFAVKSIAEMVANSQNLNFTYKPSKLSFMHPNICADIVIGNRRVGFIGKVHPKVTKNYEIKGDCYYFELALDMLPPKKFKKIKEVAKFPTSERDMAIVLADDVPVGQVMDAIKKFGGAILENVELFDIYQGEQVEAGKKSIAFNLIFRRNDRTLTKEEVNEAFDLIVQKLNTMFGATLRA